MGKAYCVLRHRTHEELFRVWTAMARPPDGVSGGLIPGGELFCSTNKWASSSSIHNLSVSRCLAVPLNPVIVILS